VKDRDWKLIWDAAKKLHDDTAFSGAVGVSPGDDE
jgi:hypothetical protein